jgi:hypothetical protein
MANRKEKPDITLESLLQLKRDERPSGEFWDSFERDFQRRRLHALVERPTLRDTILGPGMRALVFGVPVLLFVGLATFWTPRESLIKPSMVAASNPPALQTGSLDASAEPMLADPAEAVAPVNMNLASSQFVVDAIEETPGSSMSFRKVLYTPAIRLSAPSGASYVRDSMSSSNYRVTTADHKLGRNF